MKLDAKPTQRPWIVERKREVCSADNDLFTIAYASGATQDEAEANAALIVRAVNSFDALVEVLKDVLPLAEAYLKSAPGHPDNAKLEDARAALKLAEGK